MIGLRWGMRRRAARWNATLLCVGLITGLLPSSTASASALVLDAELPPEIRSCVTADQLQAAYQHALAAHGGETAAALTLHVTVRSSPGPSPQTLRLEVTAAADPRALGTPERTSHESDKRPLGTRELQVHESDCHALADAIGLVLALLARDGAASVPPLTSEPEPGSPRRTGPPASAELEPGSPRGTIPRASAELEPRTPALPSASPPASRKHLALGAGAGAISGVLPAAAFALQLQAATPGELLSLRVKVGMLLPRKKRLAEGVIEARSYELALEACAGLPWPSWPRLALRACAGPALGLIYAQGRDFLVQNQSQREVLLYFGLLPEVALRLGSATWLQLAAGGAVALIRPHFEVERAAGKGILALKTPALLRAELSLSLLQIF